MTIQSLNKVKSLFWEEWW